MLAFLVSWSLLWTIAMGQTCDFPVFTQTENIIPNQGWRTKVRGSDLGQNSEVIQISGGQMSLFRQTNGETQKSPFQIWSCHTEVAENMFTMSRIEGQVTYYQCMVFIPRSDHIMQVFTSKENIELVPNMCDETSLELSNWPWVYYKFLEPVYYECPPFGAYHVTSEQATGSNCQCGVLESECLAGEGLVLDFQDPTCIPQGSKLATTSSLRCLGAWSDGQFIYHAVMDKQSNAPYCLKYHNSTTFGEDNLTMDLSTDFVCESGEFITETDNHFNLSLTRQNPGCVDNSSSSQGSCEFDAFIRGDWFENLDSGNKTISINASDLTLGSYASFTCDRVVKTHESRTTSQIILKTNFNNGCRVRYSCAELELPAPSVLRYRIGLAEPKRVGKNLEKTEICNAHSFHNGEFPLFDTFHSEYQKSLVPLLVRSTVSCNLQGVYSFTLQSKVEGHCSGQMNQGACGESDKMHLTSKDCFGERLELNFQCLDSFNNKDGSLGLIVESLDQKNVFFCFLYQNVTAKNTTWQILLHSECDFSTFQYVNDGYKVPLTDVVIQQTGDICQTTTTTSTTESKVPKKKTPRPPSDINILKRANTAPKKNSSAGKIMTAFGSLVYILITIVVALL